MPEKVDRIPGSSLAQLDWVTLSDGTPWFFTTDEMKKLGTKPETLRAYAHTYAKAGGFKFRTKLTKDGLYLQLKG
jgi:hypothetical protein